jgi:transcriptional regulator of arginine metabolism
LRANHEHRLSERSEGFIGPTSSGRAFVPRSYLWWSPMNSLGKTQRQHRLAQLLENNAVTSQTQLVELLEAGGVRATQATVSRDLDELGAVKVRVPGGESVYAIPELPHERVAPEDHLRRMLSDWVADIGVSGNLVVLRTPPGSAHVVGSALDRSGLPEILGTVAGDDTVLVVVADGADSAAFANTLGALAGLRSEPPKETN